MPEFHVRLRTPSGLEPITEGLAFDNLEAAYLDVCRTIVPIVPDLLRDGLNPMRCTFEISDLNGATLMEVPFAEVLDPRGINPRRASNMVMDRTERAVLRTRNLAEAITATKSALTDNIQALRALLAAADRLSPLRRVTAPVRHGGTHSQQGSQFEA